MTLRGPEDLSTQEASGFRAYDFHVDFQASDDPRNFAPADAPRQQRLVDMQSIAIGYGPGPHTATFSMWSAKTAHSTTGQLLTNHAEMAPPKNGDVVWVYVKTGKDGDYLLQFKGTIDSVKEQRLENDVSYTCQAVSFAARLNDTSFIGAFNWKVAAINPTPRFDQQGILVDNRKKTIAEIIDTILDFRDPWEKDGQPRTQYFVKESINWNGLRDLPQCGKYIPAEVHFNSTPKGQAILQLLQMAGNYTYLYDPTTDKFVIVEQNLQCTRCGDKWGIQFPNEITSPDKLDTGSDKYAYEVDVKEDDTEWTCSTTANVCRITGGPIYWYSGHFFVPRRTGWIKRQANGQPDLAGGGYQMEPNSDTRHTIPSGGDTANDQIARATNFETCCYRFEDPTNIGEDRRPNQQYVVGMALFPDWNVHEDFLPATLQPLDVALPPSWFNSDGTVDAGKAPAIGGARPTDREGYERAYKSATEWQSRSVGDMILNHDRHLGRLGHLRCYQAWETDGKCPACNGTGAVQAIYSGGNNEPVIEWKAVNNNRPVPKVKNYIFDPARFGAVDPATGQLYPPAGLARFNDAGYPAPHKNLCPYCRGVGLKPLRKVRNIREELAIGRNNKAKANQGPANEGDTIDLDAIPTDAETWQESQNRIVLRLPAFITQEAVATTVRLPSVYADRNKPFEMIEKITDPAGGPPIESVQRFDHPLKFTALRKRLAGLVGIGADSPDSKIADDAWRATVPFTTVVMGNMADSESDLKLGQVIFRTPVFVSCSKHFNTFVTTTKNKYKVSGNGLFTQTSPGGGQLDEDKHGMPKGFWRPARTWLQCFYTREAYYDRLAGQADKVVQATSADGQANSYLCRAMVVDGKYCLEVKKANPQNQQGQVEFGSTSRTVQCHVSEEDASLEIYPKDFENDPCPPAPDMTDDEYAAYKADASKGNYVYPSGVVLQWHPPSQGENLLAGEGLGNADFFDSTNRPRMFTWKMRDDRSRLLGKAIRALESQNDVKVTGALTLVNIQQSLAAGLGYVDYPGRSLASVSRVTFKFGNDFLTILDLTRERARFGEPLEDEKNQVNVIEKRLDKLVNIVDQLSPKRQSQSASVARTSQAGRNAIL